MDARKGDPSAGGVRCVRVQTQPSKAKVVFCIRSIFVLLFVWIFCAVFGAGSTDSGHPGQVVSMEHSLSELLSLDGSLLFIY